MALISNQTANPTAATNTNVYTAGVGTNAVVSKITGCNRGGATIIIRVGIDYTGADAPGDSEWLVYDLPILPNQPFSIPGGITLDTADDCDVVAYTDIATLSIQVHGEEW